MNCGISFQTEIILQSINPYIITTLTEIPTQIQISTTSKPDGFNLIFTQLENNLILGNTDKASQTYLDLIPTVRLQINFNNDIAYLVLNSLDNGTQFTSQIQIGDYLLQIIYTYVCNNRQHYWTILNIYLKLYQ